MKRLDNSKKFRVVPFWLVVSVFLFVGLTPCAFAQAVNPPNDPRFVANTWDQYGPRNIQADRAWHIWKPDPSTQSNPIVIAIVDTGVDYTHEDLTNKIYRDAAGNMIGKNLTFGNEDDPYDNFGQGTHCAGIAAAQTNNGKGIAGIAGWNGQPGSDTTSIKIMPVKVMVDPLLDIIARGITWAVQHGAKVIHVGLGDFIDSPNLRNAVVYARDNGCVIVAAAGNIFDGISRKFYPAAYAETYDNVISVAATDSTDTLWGYSNYGAWVKVAAPGVLIPSTIPVAQGSYDAYPFRSGTAMASAHVAGEVALLWAQMPYLHYSDVVGRVTSVVDTYQKFSTRTIAPGGGRINAFRVLKPLTPDFDGDGRADIAVWRPSDVTWYIKSSAFTSIPHLIRDDNLVCYKGQWGWNGGYPVAADYDGDGKKDIAVWNDGTWRILYSSRYGTRVKPDETVSYGQRDDWAVPADYDGDGIAELAVWRPSEGMWYIRTSTLKSPHPLAVRADPWGYKMKLGSNGDIPVPADYDGDGRVDMAVWRRSTGMWYIRTSTSRHIRGAIFDSTPENQWHTRLYGSNGDYPLATDYDGDGRADIAVWRPSEGMWYIRTSTLKSPHPLAVRADPWGYKMQWGSPGDWPVPADYDGDRKADFAVWRPTDRAWYIVSSAPYTTPSTPIPHTTPKKLEYWDSNWYLWVLLDYYWVPWGSPGDYLVAGERPPSS
jgi:subtilisin family serine protease